MPSLIHVLPAAVLAMAAMAAAAQTNWSGAGQPALTDTEKPRVSLVESARLNATVTAIDKGSRTVQVSPNVQGLENVKVGDEVVIRQTEALAIAVAK